jgi:hypothetical protein
MNKSLFWNYFSKVLNWPLLRSRHLQLIVKGLALYLDSIRQDILYVRDQFFPEFCEPERLNDFAVSRGIKRFRFDTDEQFRLRVVNAYRWQKLGGKEQGLARILAEYGYPGAKVSYFDDKARWAEFGLEFGFGANVLGILPIINEFKPARSILGAVATPAETKGIYSVVGFSQLPDEISSYVHRPAGIAVVGYINIRDYITALNGGY